MLKIVRHNCLGVKAHNASIYAYAAKMRKNKTLRELLGENVREIRAAKKLSQPQVAAAAKRKGGQIDQTTVGRIERGDNPVEIDRLEALAYGLGVPAWQLLIPTGADEKFLAVLKAWSQSGEQGKKLLHIAALGALENDAIQPTEAAGRKS